MKPKIVTAAVVVKGGKVLVARRAPGQSNAGYWEFPGGKLEPGEDERACLAREMHEEFGVVGTAGGYVGQSVHAHARGEICLRAYWFAIREGEMQLSVHDRLRYVCPDELPALDLTAADVPIARLVREALKNADDA